MSQSTVLAVDDKHNNLVALEAVLGNAYQLIFARSGVEAIAIVESGIEIDLILMDVQMPVMDGFEAAERIKRMPQGRDIPIAFVTAVFSEDPYVKRGYKVGGIDYFNKPLDPELLRLKVEVYATFRRRNRESIAPRRDEAINALESVPVRILIVDAKGHVTGATAGSELPPPLAALVTQVLRGDGNDLQVRFEERFLGSVRRLEGGGAVVLVHDLSVTNR